MFRWYVKSLVLILCSLVHGERGQGYSDLEATGISCPTRDSCRRYRNNLTYIDRNCECDNACKTYNDCCVDFPRRNSARRVRQTRMRCLHYGENLHSGVYVIANCSSRWNESIQVKQKCEGPPDFSDPLTAAPTTSISQGVTYKNLFCAECNNANMDALTTFQIRMACEGLEDLTDTQVYADLAYNQAQGSWGVNRVNDEGEHYFVACNIIYDAPSYLNNSVRFCRANVISECMPNWNRPHVRMRCEEYMAVVYSLSDNTLAYRNPDCATCNNHSIGELTCGIDLMGRRRPMSFALLLDVNQSEGDQVGMVQVTTPACPSNQKYDPFFAKCRRLVCALPKHVIVNGRCVPGS